jgi:hypothetical protein
MKCKQHRWLLMIAVAIVGMVGASSALADFFSPSVADIQALSNATEASNLSTIDAIHPTDPNDPMGGIHLDVTWRVGQNSDPFAPGFGFQNFPRIGLARFTNGENGGTGRDLTGYMGIKWCLMTDTDNFSQPYIQTAPNWTFYEPFNGGNGIPGDMSMQMSILDFNFARNFSGLLPNNIVHPDGNGEIRANAFGLQIGGPGGMVPGQEIQGHIWITRWVPEPSTATLLLLGAVGLLGRTRRREG